MKRRIFPYDFTPYYPVGILPCPMYVDVANRIYERIKDMELNLPNSDKLKKEIAINVAIYFEDKMSGIGLWNAFATKHQLMYSHSLPFFDDFDALDKDDVNAKEVELLVWIVLSRNFDDRFLNPLTMGEEAANLIMEVLTEDDEVEVNDGFYDYIYNADKANDYFKLKHVLIWLRRSYLLCSPLSEERFEEIHATYSRQFLKSEAVYYAETSFIMKSEIGPLAVEPHLWLADMYAENEMYMEADKLRNLKYCQQDIFEVIEADPKYAVLKDSKEEVYRLKNVYPDVFWKGAYICTALVKYADNDWEINGVVFNSHREVYEIRGWDLRKNYINSRLECCEDFDYNNVFYKFVAEMCYGDWVDFVFYYPTVWDKNYCYPLENMLFAVKGEHLYVIYIDGKLLPCICPIEDFTDFYWDKMVHQ